MLKVNKYFLWVSAIIFTCASYAETPTTNYLSKPDSVVLPPPPGAGAVPSLDDDSSKVQVSGVATLNQLSQINSETNLLKAKLEREKLKWQLEKAMQGDFSESSYSGNSMPPPSTTAAATRSTEPQKNESEVLPVLLGVYGANGRLQASLRTADGVTVQAVQGDSLPGGFRVNSISVSKVTIVKDGKTYNVGS